MKFITIFLSLIISQNLFSKQLDISLYNYSYEWSFPGMELAHLGSYHTEDSHQSGWDDLAPHPDSKSLNVVQSSSRSTASFMSVFKINSLNGYDYGYLIVLSHFKNDSQGQYQDIDCLSVYYVSNWNTSIASWADWVEYTNGGSIKEEGSTVCGLIPSYPGTVNCDIDSSVIYDKYDESTGMTFVQIINGYVGSIHSLQYKERVRVCLRQKGSSSYSGQVSFFGPGVLGSKVNGDICVKDNHAEGSDYDFVCSSSVFDSGETRQQLCSWDGFSEIRC